MAAKRAWELIPYCHPIPIDHIKVDVSLKEESIEIIAEIKSSGRLVSRWNPYCCLR